MIKRHRTRAPSRRTRAGSWKPVPSARERQGCSAHKHSEHCRPGRPLCRWRRKTCRCDAVPWPHRKGSLEGCRAGGVPEAVLKSPSWQKASGYLKRIVKKLTGSRRPAQRKGKTKKRARR